MKKCDKSLDGKHTWKKIPDFSSPPFYLQCINCLIRKVEEKKVIEAYPYLDPSRPFNELSENEITFYMHLSNKTGHNDGGKNLLENKKTCGAACQGCYFKNLPPYEIPIDTAKKITKSLRLQGYDIGIVTADGFSDISLYQIKEAGSAFRLKDIAERNGNAWTSGYLLSKEGWRERLKTGSGIGYGAITISLYGTVLDFPIPGVPKPNTVKTAISNIQKWNKENPNKIFKIVTTARIFPNTYDIGSLRKLADWCLENKIDFLRWNAHANFLNLPDQIPLELTAKNIYDFYGNLAKLHNEYINEKLAFGISEDIGPYGIEQILQYLPSEWDKFTPSSNYWCRAGYRLFSINMINGEIVITGCVDRWAPVLGYIRHENGDYFIEWKYDEIERLRLSIIEDRVYGCHGGVGFNGQNRGFSVDQDSQNKIYGPKLNDLNLINISRRK